MFNLLFDQIVLHKTKKIVFSSFSLFSIILAIFEIFSLFLYLSLSILFSDAIFILK